MHGQCPHNLGKKLVDNEQSHMAKETESTVVAVQDQAISANYFINEIFKEEIDSTCQLCK